MWKRLSLLLAALILLAVPAHGEAAQVWEGTTVALDSVSVHAEVTGAVEAVFAQTGQRVEAGDPLVRLRSEKAFAAQDGTVSLITAEAGDRVDGEVLELTPMERYMIYCTVDEAYQKAETTLIHSGETLYVKCTADGTHRAVACVTEIDGNEYRALTLGGELYVGETVYLYRDQDFSAGQRVGIGTVVVNPTVAYEANGILTNLRVAEGDFVERGQLLYEMDGGEITAPVCGILASLTVQPGDSLTEAQLVGEFVPEDQICVETQVDETTAAQIAPGDAVRLTFADATDETDLPGTILSVSEIAKSGQYSVRIMPEARQTLSLGMHVEVRIP